MKMIKGADVNSECKYIMDAIHKSDYYFKGEEKNVGKLTGLYEDITDALVGCENLIENGPPSFIESSKKLREGLESRLIQASLRIILEDFQFRENEIFEDSPWIKKLKDKNYFNKATNNYSPNVRDRSYEILFNKEITGII